MQNLSDDENNQNNEILELDEYLSISEAQDKLCKSEFEKDLMKKMLNNAKRSQGKNTINYRKRGNGKTSESEFPRSEIENLFAQKLNENLSNAEPNAEVENLKFTIDFLKISLSNAEARQNKLLDLMTKQSDQLKIASDLNKLIQVEKNSLVLRLNQKKWWRFWE